jgi:hypothetical protein
MACRRLSEDEKMQVEFFGSDDTTLGVVDWDGSGDLEFFADKPCVVAAFSVNGGPRVPVVVQASAGDRVAIQWNGTFRATQE